MLWQKGKAAASFAVSLFYIIPGEIVNPSTKK